MEHSVYSGLFRGAAWTGLIRWVLRLIGLVNIVLLARLLTPLDLGLVAMATLTVGLADTFTEMGAQQLLIRQRDVGRTEIDGAWTIQVLQGILICILLLAAAPLAAAWFETPLVADLVRVLALAPLIRGFRNIGMTLARKELDFALEFRFTVYRRLGAFVITLALVVWLRDYWALVLGTVAGTILGTFLSYRMHPWRPRINTGGLGPYLRFAGAIIPLRFARYANDKSGAIVGGTIAGAGQFGLFNLAYDITGLISRELVFPFTRGLFPGLSKVNHDPELLSKVFRNMLGIAALCLLPVGAGLALVAEDFIAVVLGDAWLPAAPYLKWFAVASAVAGLNQMMASHILVVAGYESRAARFAWFRLCLFLPVVWLAGQSGGLAGIARAHCFFTLFFMPLSIAVLTRSLPLTWHQVLSSMLRPFMAMLLMALVVAGLVSQWPTAGLLRLVFCIGLGGCIYFTGLLALWVLSGRPSGAETLLYEYTKRGWNHLTKR